MSKFEAACYDDKGNMTMSETDKIQLMADKKGNVAVLSGRHITSHDVSASGRRGSGDSDGSAGRRGATDAHATSGSGGGSSCDRGAARG